MYIIIKKSNHVRTGDCGQNALNIRSTDSTTEVLGMAVLEREEGELWVFSVAGHVSYSSTE